MICGIYAVLGAYLIAAARNPSEHRRSRSRSGRASCTPASWQYRLCMTDKRERSLGRRRACVTAGRCRALVSLSREGAPASGQRIANERCTIHKLVRGFSEATAQTALIWVVSWFSSSFALVACGGMSAAGGS
jgi:hypothetical protein